MKKSKVKKNKTSVFRFYYNTKSTNWFVPATLSIEENNEFVVEFTLRLKSDGNLTFEFSPVVEHDEYCMEVFVNDIYFPLSTENDEDDEKTREMRLNFLRDMMVDGKNRVGLFHPIETTDTKDNKVCLSKK